MQKVGILTHTARWHPGHDIKDIADNHQSEEVRQVTYLLTLLSLV